MGIVGTGNLIKSAIKIILLVMIVIQPHSSLSQLQPLSNGNFLIFPNWKEGDKKRFVSRTIEKSIIEGDTTSKEILSNDIFEVLKKTTQHYIMGVQDLDGEEVDFSDLKAFLLSNLSDEQDTDPRVEKLFENVFDYIFDKTIGIHIENNTIKYKVDKWGYYQGLPNEINLDTLNQIFKRDLMQIDWFEIPDSVDIDNFFGPDAIKVFETISTQSMYRPIQSLHIPYDLELSINSYKIDTIEYFIPWFSTPVECIQSVFMSSGKNEIKIEVSYDYVIKEENYDYAKNPDSLKYFDLELKSTYILDYSSKWIKSISSESIRKENGEVFVELFEAKLEDVE